MRDESSPLISPVLSELELLDRYLAGEAAASDVDRLHAALRDTIPTERGDVERLAVIAELLQHHTGVERDLTDTAHRLDALHRRLAIRPTHPVARTERVISTRSPVRSHPPRSRPWGALSAGVAVCTIVGAVGYTVATRTMPSATPQVYVTGNAQRATVELNDGTRVMLNVGSRLEVPTGFGRRERSVTLTGEAAFVVTHASGAPFTVNAARTRTAVLGTEFAVRAYGEESAVRVAVRDGRVNENGVTLAARDIGRFSAGTAEVHRGQLVDDALAFTTGRLVLANVTLAEAVPQLERWYDVKIEFRTPSLATHRLEATLESTARADLAHTLELALHARVVVDGRVLVIEAR